MMVKGSVFDVLCTRLLCTIIFLILIIVIYHIQKNVIYNNNSIIPQTSNEMLLGVSATSDVKVINSKYFDSLIQEAKRHPRKRRMTDLTKNPKENSMQVLVNTWTDKSFSPIHYHEQYSEVFSILDGALAFFTFTDDGIPTCHILSSQGEGDKAIIVEKKQYHGMTAAPISLGYPGHAVVFENSGHSFDPSKKTKVTAKFAPVIMKEWGIDGDADYFNKILKLCPSKK